MMAEAVGIESAVTRGAKLCQLVLPLLLVVYGTSQDDMSDLISGPHLFTSGLISNPCHPAQRLSP